MSIEHLSDLLFQEKTNGPFQGQHWITCNGNLNQLIFSFWRCFTYRKVTTQPPSCMQVGKRAVDCSWEVNISWRK
jgi:hypothetical protein